MLIEESSASHQSEPIRPLTEMETGDTQGFCVNNIGKILLNFFILDLHTVHIQ